MSINRHIRTGKFAEKYFEEKAILIAAGESRGRF